MSGARILIVDDEPAIRRLLETALTGYGYQVASAGDGIEATDRVVAWRPDLVLLDLGLPRMSGFEVISAIRSWSKLPIIILSVQESEQDKIAALDAGADDYLTKPFSTGELLARVRVALRHAGGASSGEPNLVFDDLHIDLARRVVRRASQEIHLTPTEYDLLKLLAVNVGRVLTHRMILRDVWGVGYENDTQTLRVFIAQIRRKLNDDPANPRFILTEPGIGYRFREP